MLGLGLGLGIGAAQTPPLARYNIGGKAPAVVADFSAGVYGLNGAPVAFDGLFSFARLSAAWKLNGLGDWVEVSSGEPRTGHHIWKDGKLVPAGQLVESATRTQFVRYASAIVGNWGSPDSDLSDAGDDFVRITSEGGSPFPRTEIGSLTAGAGTFTAQADFREGSSGVAVLRFTGTGIKGSDTSYAVQFNFSDQSVIYAGSGGSPAVDAGFELVSPGVYRVYATVTATTITGINIYPVWNGSTAGQTVDFRYPQIVNAVTPTSFIPNTADSSVTLAGETLQINAPVLARAIGSPGPELWDDGAVVVGALWTNNGGGSYTKSSGGGSALTISNGSVPNGSNIVFSLKVSGMTGGSYNVNINGATALNITSSGDYDFVATAGSSPPDLAIIGGFSADGTVSMISARQVTMPDELTFLIKGTMTRAKEPASRTNVIAMQWWLDVDNSLDLLVATDGASTGKPYFRNENDADFTQLAGPAAALDLGVEEEFSLAFVLSATEIEGFYNGVSTGTSAYGGMANLLTTPMQIFPVGNATVKDFHVWPEALPSADMVEATA